MSSVSDQNEIVSDKAVLSSKDIYGTALFNDFIVKLSPELFKLVMHGDNETGEMYRVMQNYVLAFKVFQGELAKTDMQLMSELFG